MTEAWKMGHAAGYAAGGMLVEMTPPPDVDAVDWMMGFLVGRRDRSDADLIEQFNAIPAKRPE